MREQCKCNNCNNYKPIKKTQRVSVEGQLEFDIAKQQEYRMEGT